MWKMHKIAHHTSQITHPMTRRNRLLFYAVAWFIVLLPFLFWRSTWFGRPLTDQQISEYLRDDSKPRQIQHALVQIGERMARGDKGAAQWYPEMVRLATHRVEEIRTTDAWLMGQDAAYPQFRDTLKAMLKDESQLVRSNAALSIVRFGDDAGHDQIVTMLQPTVVTSPRAGRVTAVAKAGTPINHGTMLAHISAGGEEMEVRAPITGRIRSVAVREDTDVAAGAELAVIEPGTEQVWEALRALYLIGRMEDIPVIKPFALDSPNYPERIVQQAKATEGAIKARAAKASNLPAVDLKNCKFDQDDPLLHVHAGESSKIPFKLGESDRKAPIVSFQITEDGRAINVRLKRSSGVANTDQQALEAVSRWLLRKHHGCGGFIEAEAAVMVDPW